jgi:hypothetical protein
MKQNMQSIIDQNMRIVYNIYTVIRGHPTNESQGKLKGNFHMQAKGDNLNQVHSDQMVLEIRWGG